MAPKQRFSRFMVELVRDYNLLHPEDMKLQQVDLSRFRCQNCGYPLKHELSKGHRLPPAPLLEMDKAEFEWVLEQLQRLWNDVE